MNQIRLHPYVSALIVAASLLLVGFLIVQSHIPRTPLSATPIAWGGDLPFLNPTSYAPNQNAHPDLRNENIMQSVRSGPPFHYIPPVTVGATSSEKETPFDFDAFTAMLSRGSKAHPSEGPEESGVEGAYEFIPRALIATSTQGSTRSALQSALYEYGNEAGSYIQSYEEQHPNVAQVLKNQIEDRDNPDATKGVDEIARSLQTLGRNLAGMDAVPAAVRSAHLALAKSYVEIGGNLALVPRAKSDAELLKAVQVYDASADAFAKNYIALVLLFGSYGVTFSPEEAGSIFMFRMSAL